MCGAASGTSCCAVTGVAELTRSPGEAPLFTPAFFVMCGFSYAWIPSWRHMLVLAVVHGVFWSGLLSASAAYMTSLVPARRRAEGIGYWGLSSVTAIIVAPAIGFWIYRSGWMWLCGAAAALNGIMTIIAWLLRPSQTETASGAAEALTPSVGALFERRVFVLSLSLFLMSFGYGGVTSFTGLFAEALNVRQRVCI